MKTITIYELLGMVKDGKMPKKIKYDNCLYTFNEKKDNYYENETCSINWDYVSLHCLNEKVEIIEENKIPEKIRSNGKEFYCDNIDSWIDKEETSSYCEYLMNKYNDLIDYFDYLKKKQRR